MRVLKRKLLIAFIIIMTSLFALMGCAKQPVNSKSTSKSTVSKTDSKNQKSNSNQTASYVPTTENIVLTTDSTDLITISTQIMTKYLDEYKKDSVLKEMRIMDYTIGTISQIQGNTDKFSFCVGYSIKPFDIKSYALMGNGKEKDSWIIEKSNFVEAQKKEDGYRISKLEDNYTPTAEYITLPANSSDLKTISNQIMVKYLDQFKQGLVSQGVKITEYTINEIKDIKGDTDKFSFYVEYSLKPSDMKSYVLAGNGEVKDSWIVNKAAFVNIQKVGNEYKMTGIGTGP